MTTQQGYQSADMDGLPEGSLAYERRRAHEEGQEVTSAGGRQSASPYLFRGLPPKALKRVARILKEGAAKYEADPFGDVTKRNWHKITSDSHLEHMLAHVVLLLEGDESEDHRGHIATRALFYLHQWLVEHPEETP